MIRTILSIAFLTGLAMANPLKADPPPRAKNKKQKTTVPKVVPASAGWSLVNGVWTHSDGYQFIKGQVVRAGAQTHKKPPPPPTKAEMDAATKKKPAAKTPADIAAEKAAERERNLTPRAASQTGSHL
jgi:hypothetical protein